MAWATPTNVRDRWLGPGPLKATDAQLATLIADAEDTAIREYPTIPDRISAGTLPLPRVVKAICRMVIRHARNPEGVRFAQEGAGPFQASRSYVGDRPGVMELSEEDRADLAPPRKRAYTIDTTPAPAEVV